VEGVWNVKGVSKEQADLEREATAAFVRDLTDCQEDLFLFIRTLCGDPHAAADIRQAVNMVLWEKRARFQPGTQFRSWAYRIAHIEVKAYFRKCRREANRVLDPAVADLAAEEFPATLDELPERRLALARCMEKLTRKDSQLLHHRYWLGGSLESLAWATDRSVGTLKARLFQLRSALRRCIHENLKRIEA
jgi:RNA polymerase sigma-70 factor, ECF subfamily